MAARFQSLRVSDVRKTTPDAVVVTLDAPPAFRTFMPGQYLTLRATIGGQDIRRSYSICSSLDSDPLRLAIKHLPGGTFSSWANNELRAGDTILAMRPDGRFGVPIEPGSSRVLAAFAAGSGITPILSIMTTMLAREPASRFFLFFGNRATKEIMFRDEIEDLKDRYMSRLSVFHVLSRERQELDILNGHLDAEKIPALTRLMPPPDHVFVCGPQGMIEGLEPALAGGGIPSRRIHVERFTPSSDAPRPPLAVVEDAPPAAMATLIADGARVEVPMAADETIVDAALRAGRDPPFSCKAGMCCTCRARLVEGKVEMAANYSLQPWEIEAGYVLTCQARPLTARVMVDYDQV
ncbi:MAG: 2Fe-2S iron-sulfur cluster binding domain-containing protein [Acetobacteraceae bacterium]|nr:2Fe-2S iron-sulfur cluster binding domain-containing protein [Acetobacteraceae bacterium]